MSTVREPDWDKVDGLLPAIVQDARSGAVLMLGYMNREALAATRASGRVTFFSRSRQAVGLSVRRARRMRCPHAGRAPCRRRGRRARWATT